MRNKISILMAGVLSCTVGFAGEQDPRVSKEIESFQGHFLKQHKGFEKQDFSNGPYPFDEDKMLQYEAQMDMPPFEDHLDKGEGLWNKPFKNGKTFASCFSMPGEEIRASYPRWDDNSKSVLTLEQDLNNCRTKNGESKWAYKKGNISFVSAYLNNLGAGTKINVIVPKGNEDAFNAWNEGKTYFYTKRGQLNLACADCHVYSSGKRIRGDILSSALGHTTHFPVWRGKWAKNSGNGFGTLHRRYGGCNKQVRAEPRKAQSEEYRNLEYYHTSVSNGLEYVGTEYRQ